MRKDYISMPRQKITLPPQYLNKRPPEANGPWPDKAGGQYPGAVPAPHQQMSLPPQQMPPAAMGFGDIMGVVRQGDGPSPEQMRAKKRQEMRAMIEQRIIDQREGRATGEDQVLGFNETDDGYWLQLNREAEPMQVFFDDVME